MNTTMGKAGNSHLLPEQTIYVGFIEDSDFSISFVMRFIYFIKFVEGFGFTWY